MSDSETRGDKLALIPEVLRAFRRVGRWVLVWVVVLGFCVAYSVFIEPHWLVVRTVVIKRPATLRLIHITDIHYKGDREYLSRVIDRINAIPADLVCFTGDLVEEREALSECLAIIARINKPIIGIPGNHDLWARVPVAPLREAFARGGGMWLADTNVLMLNGSVEIVASSGDSDRLPRSRLIPSAKRVLLSHYPGMVDGIRGPGYDLILAGHSHGGQVRIPLVGGLIMPFDVRPYDTGLFQTRSGPLYVNPGIGTFCLDVRFNCRPEIAVLAL